MLTRTVSTDCIVAVAATLTTSAAWAQGSGGYDCGWGGHMMGWGGGWYGMFLGPLFMILVLVAVVAAAVVLVRRSSEPWHGATPPSRKAIDILKERFARGEIGKEEFEEKRRILGE